MRMILIVVIVSHRPVSPSSFTNSLQNGTSKRFELKIFVRFQFDLCCRSSRVRNFSISHEFAVASRLYTLPSAVSIRQKFSHRPKNDECNIVIFETNEILSHCDCTVESWNYFGANFIFSFWNAFRWPIQVGFWPSVECVCVCVSRAKHSLDVGRA